MTTAGTRAEGSTASRRFVSNVVSNIALVVVTTLVMLWYVPYLVRHLGVAAYGIVPLANSIVVFLSVVTEGLTVAVHRNLTIEIARKDKSGGARTFATAFWTALLLGGAMAPVGLLGALVFPDHFTVPGGLTGDAQIVFAAVLLTFLLTFVRGVLDVPAVATHRFDLYNAGKAASLLVRVVTVVLLFALLEARLAFVGVGLALGALASVAVAWVVARRLAPELSCLPRDFDRERLRGLSRIGAWSVVNRTGMLLFLGIDLILANRFFGSEEAGRYATLVLFPELLRTLADSASTVLSPALLAHYAVEDDESLHQLTLRAVKLLGLALALPVGLLCGFGGPFLELWLGPEFRDLHLVLALLVGHLSLTLSTRPLMYVLTAHDRVRVQGLVTLGLGVGNLLLALLLGVVLNLGIAGIAAATALMMLVKNALFSTWYTARVTGRDARDFRRALAHPTVATCVVVVLSLLVERTWALASWPALAGAVTPVVVSYAAAAWFFALDGQDRSALLRLAPRGVSS